MTEPYVVPAGAGEQIDLETGTTLHLLAGTRSTDGRLTVLDGAHPPGGGPPWHVHTDVDEAFFVLEGSYRFFAGDVEMDASPGSFAFLPAGVPHRYVVGDAGGRALYLYVPGGIEGYFACRAEAEARGDRAAAHRVAERFGVRWVDPALVRPDGSSVGACPRGA